MFLTRRNYNDSDAAKIQIKNILVVRPNHRLGNQLLLTPLLREIEKLYPGANVSLLVKGNAGQEIFKTYNLYRIYQLPRKPLQQPLRYLKVLIQSITPSYDVAFNAIPTSSSGRLFTSWADAKIRFLGYERTSSDLQVEDDIHMGKAPVYDFRRLVSALKNNGLIKDRINRLDIRLTDQELKQGHDILRSLFHNAKPTIVLYTYATRDKIYSNYWWREFFDKLKDRHTDHNFLEVLPIEIVSQLSFSITTFYSRDIREIASVIGNSSVFIGADSGMMHLASSSGAPTVGLFKVTDIEKYAPYGNGSQAFNTDNVDIDTIVGAIEELVNNRLVHL